MSQKDPVIVWVVGDNTNVGKTTISAALIRALNEQGIATVGFKPYAGARLIDVIDLLEYIADSDGQLVGRDARKLVQASALLSNNWLEVVNPSWRVSHPVRDVSILVRKGSTAIGQRSFLHTRNAGAFWERPDLLKLNAVMKLPLEAIQPIDDRSADTIDFADQSVQVASFNLLRTVEPEIIVCEGAGRLLPTWLGAPAVRHLLFVSFGYLHFFPNIGIEVAHPEGEIEPLTIAAITRKLTGAKRFKTPIPLSSPSGLDQEMDRFIRPIASVCAQWRSIHVR